MKNKIHTKNAVLIFIISFLSTYLIFASLYQESLSKNNYLLDSSNNITLAFVGDLMCHTPQIKAALNDSGKVDFEPVFELVKDYLSQADFTSGNLETTIGDSSDSFTGYPRFKSPSEYISALKIVGFDLLFTANNHILDYGEKGIFKTIKYLNHYQIPYTGSFESFNDYDSLRIFNINNIKVCFIAATYGTNGNLIPGDKKFLINLINFDSLKSQIIKARKALSDLIVINLHFGEEYSFKPSRFQKQVVDSLITYGADIIVGNHPHVLQPLRIEKSINSNLDTVVIAYSLGNFISNQRKLETATGAIIFITVQKETKTNIVRLKKIKLLSTYVYKGKIGDKIQYKIIPLTNNFMNFNFSNYNSIDKEILKKSYELSKRILTKYFSNDIIEFYK